MAFLYFLSHYPTNKWLRAHQMSVNGKTLGISYLDLMEAGNKMGIKDCHCRDIISEVEVSIAEFQVIAEQVHNFSRTEGNDQRRFCYYLWGFLGRLE